MPANFKMSAEARARGLAAAKATLAAMTPEEDAAITAAAETDPDARPMTDEEFAGARRGRPPLARPKQAIKLRLDADLVDSLRATGDGWQTRVNTMLREGMGLQREAPRR